MPAILDEEAPASTASALQFPPVTKAHILNCSYHSWHPKYKTITPKSRLIPLTQPFLVYLRADGIILPDDDDDPREQQHDWDSDSGVFSSSDAQNDGADDEEQTDVAADWRNLHNQIRTTIADLGGKVVPKLNWSAPKDATWMNANTMECRNPNDIYLLLKSSDFITHDLEYAFDDTVATAACDMPRSEIPYHLILRKAFAMNPSVEFRCFVRRRRLLCICQRDLNHFDFLAPMVGKLRSLIQEFFDVRLRNTFEDESFVFDCYVPNPYQKVWLVDINPWAPRTDPLLFSWLELLQMPEPPVEDDVPEQFVRLSLNGGHMNGSERGVQDGEDVIHNAERDPTESESGSDSDEEIWLPELRLVKKTDPEAYSFNSPQYSAHKLPRDVVEASQSGEGLREFAKDWESMLAVRRQQDDAAESSEDE